MRLMRMFICFDLINLLLGIYTKGIIPKKKHAMHTKKIITVFLTIFKWNLHSPSHAQRHMFNTKKTAISTDFYGHR